MCRFGGIVLTGSCLLLASVSTESAATTESTETAGEGEGDEEEDFEDA